MRSGAHEPIALFVTNLPANIINLFGNVIGRMARNVLRDGPTEKFATGVLHSPSKSFCFGKNIIRYRDRGFHTLSITHSEVRNKAINMHLLRATSRAAFAK